MVTKQQIKQEQDYEKKLELMEAYLRESQIFEDIERGQGFEEIDVDTDDGEVRIVFEAKFDKNFTLTLMYQE